MLIAMGLAGGLSMLLVTVSFVTMKKESKSFNNISNFECGFSAQGVSRLPFSLQFFMISVVFIIFDLELILMFPFLSSEGKSESWVMFLSFLGFMMGTTLYEWLQKGLEWEE